jgi:hypothetical protein
MKQMHHPPRFYIVSNSVMPSVLSMMSAAIRFIPQMTAECTIKILNIRMLLMGT